jgi:hypothetical protein
LLKDNNIPQFKKTAEKKTLEKCTGPLQFRQEAGKSVRYRNPRPGSSPEYGRAGKFSGVNQRSGRNKRGKVPQNLS